MDIIKMFSGLLSDHVFSYILYCIKLRKSYTVETYVSWRPMHIEVRPYTGFDKVANTRRNIRRDKRNKVAAIEDTTEEIISTCLKEMQ